MNDLQQLIIYEAKRVIELLKNDKLNRYSYEVPELCNKMKEFRRDSVRLEKKLYSREY